MISLIVPLFLLLMILMIFYIFDLHLSIKSTSSSTTTNFDVNDDNKPSSWTDNLPGANLFSDITDITDVSGVSGVSDVSGVNDMTQDNATDISAVANEVEVAGYDRDDVIAMLNNIAVNTNVGVVISDISDTDTVTDTDTSETSGLSTLRTRVNDLEYVINNFIKDHSHNLVNFNNIYSEETADVKLCDPSSVTACGDYESCALMCSNDDDCAGWVYDLSDSYRSICNSSQVNVLSIPDISSGLWKSVQKQGDRSYNYGSTLPMLDFSFNTT